MGMFGFRSGLLVAAAVVLAVAAPSSARACGPVIEIQFYESSPDVMSVRNRSEQAWSLTTLTFNLTPSRGSLIFDTEFGGDGADSPYPFEILAGNAVLLAEPSVTDGGSVLAMLFSGFGPGQSVDFAVDLDDRLANSIMGQAMVVGAEIEGGEVRGTLRSPDGQDIDVRGAFNDKNVAHLTALTCV